MCVQFVTSPVPHLGVFHCSNFLITGDVSVSPLECGATEPRHQSPGTVPPVYEAAVVWALPVAADARTHLPWCQARAVQGKVTSSNIIFRIYKSYIHP